MANQSKSEFKHGTMDTRVQEKTFAGFVHMVIWAVAIIFVILVFMALSNA